MKSRNGKKKEAGRIELRALIGAQQEETEKTEKMRFSLPIRVIRVIRGQFQPSWTMKTRVTIAERT
jgi:hypothetical protein